MERNGSIMFLLATYHILGRHRLICIKRFIDSAQKNGRGIRWCNGSITYLGQHFRFHLNEKKHHLISLYLIKELKLPRSDWLTLYWSLSTKSDRQETLKLAAPLQMDNPINVFPVFSEIPQLFFFWNNYGLTLNVTTIQNGVWSFCWVGT